MGDKKDGKTLLTTASGIFLDGKDSDKSGIGSLLPSLYLVLHVEDDVADFPLQRRLVEHLLSFAVDFPELVPHYG